MGSKMLSERFWGKVDRRGPGECWEWTASRDQKGYGRINIGGKHGTPVIASRVAFELTFRPLLPGECVLHSCDNPPCVNPAHLRAGTYRDNNRDTVLRGRHFSWSAKKTACPQGHPYDGTNSRGERTCSECLRQRSRESYHRKKAAVV